MLARIVGSRDGGEIALVEQRELQRTTLGQGLDLRRTQAGDPVEPGGLDVPPEPAAVIMPPSPASSTCFGPDRRFSFSTCAGRVLGSPVSPSSTSIAIGRPSRSQRRP